jgi:hypothetical protein
MQLPQIGFHTTDSIGSRSKIATMKGTHFVSVLEPASYSRFRWKKGTAVLD